ncbi:MAG: hypothetical protein FWG90_01865 [Oscillospiraceae bacterium]|nr:hypothetical protein [Oscillospiraceae bacterium]
MNQTDDKGVTYITDNLTESEAVLVGFYRVADNEHKKRLLMIAYKMNEYLYGKGKSSDVLNIDDDFAIINKPKQQNKNYKRAIEESVNKLLPYSDEATDDIVLNLQSFCKNYKSAKVTKKKCVDSRYHNDINVISNLLAKKEYNEAATELHKVMTEFKKYRYCYDFHNNIVGLLAEHFEADGA